MKRFALSLSLFLPLLTSCGNKPFDCATERTGNWAIQLQFTPDPAGECAHAGTYIYEEKSHDLKCEVSADFCVCAGGTEYGIYDIALTELATGTVSTGTIEVSPAQSPTCVVREATSRFMESEAAGGAGGDGAGLD